jgi:hypothetical protein
LVKKLVEEGDEDALVALCLDDKKTLRLAQRLLYDPVSDKSAPGWPPVTRDRFQSCCTGSSRPVQTLLRLRGE